MAHALDHLILLVFATAVATAVATIAADFGVARWEDLMPYSGGAFGMFGLGSLPAGKLGDSWGRRPMIDDAGIGQRRLAVQPQHQRPWPATG